LKIDLPPEISGGNPAGLLDHLGLNVVQTPTPPDTTWVVSVRQVDLVKAQTLGPPRVAMRRLAGRSRLSLTT
jgi:hypothetical protein